MLIPKGSKQFNWKGGDFIKRSFFKLVALAVLLSLASLQDVLIALLGWRSHLLRGHLMNG